ncbi:uncharacterized protein F4807DRAFT_458349 [Annulohypoxylon truncatum]|uniref:uncharacterized protein n=1 Tax=Annulohypoxylon truncatum TaxID=327061 RepID=UPI00200879EE|nr:uncharacterized protein F4807DRAFT_458349 [Annulohypoxylon truncatum]KAI1212146.1 hypothetical protein F4807DRAFT_458349 [Annulohypoxylon truncatum]
MSIVAMGSFVSDSVRSTSGSYKGTSTKVSYVSAQNLAAILYPSINKYPAVHPIPPMITVVELDIHTVLGLPTDVDACTRYEWKVYPKDTLYSYIKETSIGSMTRAPVDHTLEDLTKTFTPMVNSLFSNRGSIPAGYTPRPMPEGQRLEQELHPHADGRPTGKSRLRQVIVLENIINRLENIVESFKSREKAIVKMCIMLETMVEKEPVTDGEMIELNKAVKIRFPEEFVQFEEATAVVTAKPALIEGNTGMIKGTIQPSAPLIYNDGQELGRGQGEVPADHTRTPMSGTTGIFAGSAITSAVTDVSIFKGAAIDMSKGLVETQPDEVITTIQ